MAQMPDPFPSLLARIKRIEDRLNQRLASSPFFNTGLEIVDPSQLLQSGSITIPDNGLLLVDGGDVVMLNSALVEVFRLGVMPNGDRGITIRRDDNSVALEVRDALGSGAQSLRFYDRGGAVIGGDSILSPSGFDAPHLAMPFIPTDYTSAATAQTTSSATFVATHEHRGFKQNPALIPQFMVKCSDATTAAEVQVYDVLSATYLGGFLGTPAVHTITVPVGTVTFTEFMFSSALNLPGGMSADLHLEIHARRTAGTGSVSVAPVRSVGSGF